MYLARFKWSFIIFLAMMAPVIAGAQSASSYDAYGQPAAVRRAAYRRPRHHRVVVVHRRPFSHSVAIVGGSALAGAGVGALVGGGPGAIVGGLTGGVGGLIYDRKTHRRRRVVIER